MPMRKDRDHSAEIEQRMQAIPVDGQDTCAFWTKREFGELQLLRCWYCRYGQFNRDGSDPHQTGYCKYRPVCF